MVRQSLDEPYAVDPNLTQERDPNHGREKMRSARKLWLCAVASTTALVWAGGIQAQTEGGVEFGSGASGFPESVTSTSDGTLYAGSLAGGMIHRAAPGAAAAEAFIDKPAEGPGAVIGVLADEANGTLWACYSDLAAFAGGEALPSVLRSYDLESGEETGAFTFPAASFCNDIVTTSDGTAFAADTSGARILRIAPGATEAETWFADPQLAGVDGLAFGQDGALYVNSVTANKLFRLDVNEDGTPGTLTELTLSEAVQGPDGMRAGPDGTLYLAENAAGRVSELTIDGDNVTVRELQGGFNGPTAVTLVGDTLWVAEAKIGMLGGQEDPDTFYVYPVPLSGGDAADASVAGDAAAGAMSTETTDTAAGSDTAAEPATDAAASDAAEGADAAAGADTAAESSTDAAAGADTAAETAEGETAQ